jgi:hypothetical protein
MATQEDAEKKSKERREAEEKNPLLKRGLGDLVNEALQIVSKDPELDSHNSYCKYHQIIGEINRRYPKPGLDYDKIERNLSS